MVSNQSSKEVAGPGARQLAELFHATYERPAPQYGYTTRSDTRRFDHGTENGKLMIAVCDYILTWLDEKAPAEIDRLTARVAELEAELWVVAECIWQNVSSEDAKHWARGIRVSITGKPGESMSRVTVETTGEQK